MMDDAYDDDQSYGEDEDTIFREAFTSCKAKLAVDIAQKCDVFLENVNCELLSSHDKDAVLYVKNKKGVERAVSEILDLIETKDGFIDNLLQALEASSLHESCRALNKALKRTKDEDVDYKQREANFEQTNGNATSNGVSSAMAVNGDDMRRSQRETEDDEDQAVSPVTVRAVIRCHDKLCADIEGQFNAVLGQLSCLSVDDKDAITYVEQLRGLSSGVKETLSLVVSKANFIDDLTDALDKCSLTDASTALTKAVKVETAIDEEYNQRLAEFEKTKDATQLKRLAGTNQGYKRTEVAVKRFIPRNYQIELASKAIDGENCLICAPTNSGKTFISIMIAKQHLKTYADPDNKPCVVFVVPRFALLQQIYSQYRMHLPLKSIGKKSGSSPSRIKLASLVKTDDVIIVTADILKNDLRNKLVSFSDISLLVFDECHHANKDHSYNKIMEMYIRSKGIGANRDGYPQVVGLTASPGAGKAPSATGAQEWIIRLCSNIDARHFVTVKEHVEELKQYANISKRDVFSAKDRVANPFEEHVCAYMLQLELYVGMVWSAPRTDQEYLNYLHLLKEAFVKSSDRDKVFYCEHLCKIHEALCLSGEVRLEDGMAFLGELYDKIKRPNMQDFEIALIAKFEDLMSNLTLYKEWEAQYPNPKLEKVKEMIMMNKAECDDNDMMEFRAMVHSKTRQTTLALYNWMQSDPDLQKLNTQYLTGIHASVDEGGMTSESTKKILQQFDEGKVKVLVCTSVGEEGLNIVACRLIIRYNHVTNEISMIQARGRIRAEDGHEVIIGDDTVLAKDKTNVLLEEVMQIAMDSIMELEPSEFCSRVNQYQWEAMQKIKEREMMALQHEELFSYLDIWEAMQKIKEREMMALQQEELHSYLDTGSNLLCAKCDEFACPLSEIRTACGSNYINPTNSFSKKIMFKPHDNPKKRRDGIQKIFCKNCGHDWGNTFSKFPCIKIASFVIKKVLESGEIERKTTKQWKKVDHRVPPLSMKD